MVTIHNLNIRYKSQDHQHYGERLLARLNHIWQHQAIITNKTLIDIVERVITQAAIREIDHGYSGAMSSSGADQEVDKLKGFLEGIVYANTLDITKTQWASVAKTIELEQDPELVEFERLKKKFAHLEQK